MAQWEAQILHKQLPLAGVSIHPPIAHRLDLPEVVKLWGLYIATNEKVMICLSADTHTLPVSAPPRYPARGAISTVVVHHLYVLFPICASVVVRKI